MKRKLIRKNIAYGNHRLRWRKNPTFKKRSSYWENRKYTQSRYVLDYGEPLGIYLISKVLSAGFSKRSRVCEMSSGGLLVDQDEFSRLAGRPYRQGMQKDSSMIIQKKA